MPTDLEIIQQLSRQIGTELVELRRYLRRPNKLPGNFRSVVRRWDIGPETTGYCVDPKGNVLALFLNGVRLNEFPMIISRLTNLNVLMLYDNELNNLPPEIGQLTNLTGLYVFVNHLGELPAQIGQLTNLISLYIPDNKLTALPRDIIHLQRLKELELAQNPLNEPPPEIVRQGTEAIFEYLRLVGAQIVNEAKLILVGEGDVGKTCLVRRLMYDTFQAEKSTEGIDILPWEIAAPTEEQADIKLNVWDFGGQEIYHHTHQFFLTKRSVYLMVWNARKSHDYEHIYSWLHTIEAFGEDSPAILVLSKCHERDDDLNMKDLKEQFPHIVCLHKVDSKDATGIPALARTISQQSWDLPQMRTPWPDSWLTVRKRLEGISRPQNSDHQRNHKTETAQPEVQSGRDWIEYQEFQSIYEQEGLDEKQIIILDEYLHDLGVIIHFRHRSLSLRNMVILKPEWATNAVYKVLDTQAVRDREGILLHSELDQIWDQDRYPSAIFPNLLELMNQFELAYELADRNSHLVAELLRSTEPDDIEWNDSDNLRFFYRYDFLPASVMTRFIVRVHHDLEYKADGNHLCWREGAVLQREGTRALVKVKPVEKRVEVKISGEKKRDLLAVIRRELDHINGAIKTIKATQEIPCDCSPNCINVFDYLELITGELKGEPEIQCTKKLNMVPLSKLLDGYEGKRNRHKRYFADERIVNVFQPHIEVNPNINVTTNVDFDIKIDLPAIQAEFLRFKRAVAEVDDELDNELKEELQGVEDDLLGITPSSDEGKINRAMNKLSLFMQNLGDEDSKLNRMIKGSKRGIELAQGLAGHFNKFATGLGLSQVPNMF